MQCKNRRLLSLFLSLALVVGILAASLPMVSFAEKEAKTLTILHTNDIHGRFQYDDGDRDPSIGHAKFKTLVEDFREKGNVLLLDAGDVLHGTTDINLSKGKAMVNLMNLLEVDAMVPGNHDFNYGYERLLELKEMADFPIIAANLVHESDGSRDFDEYIVKEYDGFKVGIFAIATEETKVKSHPDNTKGIEFTDYIEASKKAVKDLQKENVDIIIGLTHVGVDGETDVTTRDIAKKVEGIDVIVDGHSHTRLEKGELVGDTLIVQTGSHLSNIGIVKIELKYGKIDKKASLFTVKDAEKLQANKEVEDVINKMEEANKLIKQEVIGKSHVDLIGERDIVRTGESTLGNLITDAMLDASNADIAITNGGGIRASITAGDITVEEVLQAFPFTNFSSSIEVSGKEIVDALEHGVKAYPETAGGFPHVAGMKYEFDSSKRVGEKVTKVLIGEKEIDLDKKYELVTNDFMAIGGDGYEMFKGKKIISEGGLFSDILVDYLKKVGEVEPKIEGRIIAVKGEEVKPKVKLEVKSDAKSEVKREIKLGVKLEAKKYTVVAGDVLWTIAEKYNTTWEKLAEFNNLKNPHLIFPNQVILIP